VRLKDMLGFDDVPGPPADEPESAGPPEPGPPARFDDPALPPTREIDLPRAAAPRAAAPSDPATPEAPERPAIDEAALKRALEAALHSFVSREPKAKAEEEAKDPLIESPIFNVQPRPARRSPPAGSTYQNPTANALSVIASDVSALGVPERHRATTRAALLDLAGHLDRHDLTWPSLREAVHLVMEYPILARRVLPLLLPYLEEAA
jgi:hypothetical protein